MKEKYTALAILRLFAFVFVLGSVILQPIMRSMTLFNDHEIIAIDFTLDTDTGENESPEEDEAKDQKMEPLVDFKDQKGGNFAKKHAIFAKQYLFQDYTLEIHVPPPEHS